MNGKHIELFLVDGVAGGLTTAEIAGWTGHLLAGPRTELARILARDEAQRNGTYILLGNDPGVTEQTRAYIGRTESFTTRFRDHDAKKDFWDRMVIMTAKDDAFNEGHWGYLEARLVEQARLAERCHLENGNTPQGRKLSEAQRSDMEAFFAQLQVILPVLGVNILRSRKTAIAATQEITPTTESPIFHLKLAKHHIDARGQVIDGEFLLLEGSRIAPRWMGKASTEATQRSYASLQNTRNALVNDGSIHIDSGTGVATTTRDIPCSSPSQAGALAVGRACNGRTSWTWDGGTYADWEERGLTPQN